MTSQIIPFPTSDRKPEPRAVPLSHVFQGLLLDHCSIGFCYHWLDNGKQVCTGCTNNNEDGGPDDAA